MDLEKKILRGAVIEGYTVLMKAEAELLLPSDKTQIEGFYLALSKKCMTWATEVRGEKLRELFLNLDGAVEKSHFLTRRYRFQMRCPWEYAPYAAILCESVLEDEDVPMGAFRRVSHVWNVDEETMLPQNQILHLLGIQKELKSVGFLPDGIYPENDTAVFYKNTSKSNQFMEVRRKIGKTGRK